MRYVVEVELARRGALILGDALHGANIAATRVRETALLLAVRRVADRLARFLDAAAGGLAGLVDIPAGFLRRAFLMARGERDQRDQYE
jgi:hypothetical protein